LELGFIAQHFQLISNDAGSVIKRKPTEVADFGLNFFINQPVIL